MASIVSLLAQNLYVMCTLSKRQMKNITAFWKAMMLFISPESAPITNKIRVSYNSCLREAERRYDAAQERQTHFFETCLYFSLALDTSKYGQDNFLSCVGRFGFEEKIAQEIIILEKITATTGKDTAKFVFDKLAEKRCDFAKMVSITTDGAKTMNGHDHGMAMELIRLVNEKRT